MRACAHAMTAMGYIRQTSDVLHFIAASTGIKRIERLYTFTHEGKDDQTLPYEIELYILSYQTSNNFCDLYTT